MKKSFFDAIFTYLQVDRTMMSNFYMHSSGWFSNNLSVMNNISFSYTELLYNDIWYHRKYIKYTNNIAAQFLYLETRYDQHNYFGYYRPSMHFNICYEVYHHVNKS